MKRSAHENLKAAVGLETASISAATTNGTGIDCKDYEEALVIFNAGVAAASAEADVKVQESSDNSSWSDITGAAFTQVTTANDQGLYVGRLDLRKRERYLRVVNAADGTNAVLLGVVVVLAGSARMPVTQENTVAFSI